MQFGNVLADAAKEYSTRVVRDPKTGSDTNSDPCAFMVPSPQAPTNFAADLKQAKEMSLFSWINRVRGGGKWDFKRLSDPGFAPYGKFHYGATASAQGFPPGIVLAGAAGYQMIDDFGEGSPTMSDHEDDPPIIVRGIAYFNYFKERICKP